MTEWIPVTTALPENSELVNIGHDKDKWVCSGHWYSDIKEWYNQFDKPCDDAPCYPTHWQPLPSPPEQIKE
jgi:hypothetical protein